MFQAIHNFISDSDTRAVTSENVDTLATMTFTTVSKDVIPAIDAALHSDEFFKSPNIRVIENMGGSLGLRTNDPVDVIKKIYSFFKDVAAEEHAFKELVEKDVSERFFPSMSKAREMAIIKTLSDVSDLSLFTIDLLYYVTVTDDTQFPKKRIETLHNSIPYYISLLKVYMKDFSKHVKELAKVANEDVKVDAPASLMDKVFSKHGSMVTLPITNGFINNPIYHVRLYFVDEEVDKYEAMKEKKKLLELKLLDIKMRASGKHDEKLRKQIAYYEEKISELEYDIKEIAEDV